LLIIIWLLKLSHLMFEFALISLKTSEALNFENEKVKELLHEVTDIIFANTGVDISSVELNLYTE
ncbi:hypothetical protein ACVETM_16570, partial [Acinetobacter baumannii]